MKINNELLARVMILGAAVSTAVLAVGLIWYLAAHGVEPAGDHVFTGEPHFLKSPGDMVKHVFSDEEGRRRALTMTGLLLLLLNPPLRVLLTAAGWIADKDRLYAAIGLAVLAVLLLSLSGM